MCVHIHLYILIFFHFFLYNIEHLFIFHHIKNYYKFYISFNIHKFSCLQYNEYLLHVNMYACMHQC